MSALLESPADLREKAFRALNQLPPFSPTLGKLLAILAQEDVLFGQLSAIIEKDTVLAAHVLKLVNSVLYARSGTINSVRHAVSILGLGKLRNIALSLSVSRMCQQVKTPKSWSQAAFNLHSVATAVMADLLAQRLDVVYPEGAFTAGLMHAVGKLMIAVGLPDHYERILAIHREGGLTMEEAELQVIGCSHAELGAAALNQWNLPIDIQEAVAFQDRPRVAERGRMDLSLLLHDAHAVVNSLDVMIPACACPIQEKPEDLLGKLGLAKETVAILEEYKTEFGTMRGFF